MKESAFQRKVIQFLESCGVYVVNVWGGGFQRAGIPDLLCCVNGQFVAVELKTDAGKVSKLQEHNLERIRSAHGTAMLLRPSGFDEFKQWIQQEVSRPHD